MTSGMPSKTSAAVLPETKSVLEASRPTTVLQRLAEMKSLLESRAETEQYTSETLVRRGSEVAKDHHPAKSDMSGPFGFATALHCHLRS